MWKKITSYLREHEVVCVRHYSTVFLHLWGGTMCSLAPRLHVT